MQLRISTINRWHKNVIKLTNDLLDLNCKFDKDFGSAQRLAIADMPGVSTFDASMSLLAFTKDEYI